MSNADSDESSFDDILDAIEAQSRRIRALERWREQTHRLLTREGFLDEPDDDDDG